MQDNSIKTNPSEIEVVKPAEIKDGQLILTPKHKALIKEQIAPNATNQELDLFFMMAYRTKLDPLLKQLYFIKYGQGDRAKVSYVTSIDGYRIIAHRTKQFAGIDEPVYKYTKKGDLYSCTITVWRKDSDRGFSATVALKEYNTGKNLWVKMPLTMIAKVAEAHALRKAFPHDLSGIYTTDEMDQAENNKTQAPQPPKKATFAQLKKIEELLTQKDKNEGAILSYFKVNTLDQLNGIQAGRIINQLSKMPDPELDADLPPIGEPQPDDDVDLDEVEAGIEAQKVEEAEPAPEVNHPSKVQVGILESCIKTRATQSKKSYESMLAKLLKNIKMGSLADLNIDEYRKIMKIITSKNEQLEDRKLEDVMADVEEALGAKDLPDDVN